MSRLLKIFITAFLISFCFQVVWGLPVVQDYIREEIKTAKILCLKAKYMIRPEGISL